eukprot:15345116-Ditylum_brightwellii.AAC.1
MHTGFEYEIIRLCYQLNFQKWDPSSYSEVLPIADLLEKVFYGCRWVERPQYRFVVLCRSVHQTLSIFAWRWLCPYFCIPEINGAGNNTGPAVTGGCVGGQSHVG